MIYSFAKHNAFSSNCHVITDGCVAVVIDPSVSLNEIRQREPRLKSVSIYACILTHAHADHFLEIKSYIDAGARIIVPDKEVSGLNDLFYTCAFMLGVRPHIFGDGIISVTDGEVISTPLGDIRVLWTPGHTHGSVCYLFEDCMFSGDTVFAGASYGRYDLPSGSISELAHTIELLRTLPETLRVYSGHGGDFILGQTLKYINI